MTRFKTRLFSGAALVAASFTFGTAVQAQTETVFDIPAGPLDQALDAWSEQSGKDLIYRTDQVDGLTVGGVEAMVPSEEALNLLLTGSNLRTRSDRSGAILVFAQADTARRQAAARTPTRMGLPTMPMTALATPTASPRVQQTSPALVRVLVRHHPAVSTKSAASECAGAVKPGKG